MKLKPTVRALAVAFILVAGPAAATIGPDGEAAVHRDAWTDRVELSETPPDRIPAALARLQGLSIDRDRCEQTPSLDRAVAGMQRQLGLPATGPRDDVDLDPRTARTVARLTACLDRHAKALSASKQPLERVDGPAGVLPAGDLDVSVPARAAILSAMDDLLGEAASVPALSTSDGVTCVDPSCRIQIGGPGNNVYTRDAILILDSGGSDRYENNAAGANALDGIPVAVLVDQGTAADEYVPAQTDLFGAPTIGAGADGGVGVLVDEGGDDRYRALGGTMGAGYRGGGGALLDRGGNDTYDSVFPDGSGSDPTESHKVTMGAAAFASYGMLIDRAGDDVYHQKGVDSIGYGGAGSTGLVRDDAGDDVYRVDPAPTTCGGSPCPIPETSFSGVSLGVGEVGGVGIVLGSAGDDRYACRDVTYYNCLGGAHVGGAFGLMFDPSGDDAYSLGDKPAGTDWIVGGMAAAARGGEGYFVDTLGNDTYESDAHYSGGYGFAGGQATMADLGAGDDQYDFVGTPIVGTRADDSVWMAECPFFTPTCGQAGVGVDR